MLPLVDEEQRARDRHARAHARNERRRARGLPAFEFDEGAFLSDGWVAIAPAHAAAAEPGAPAAAFPRLARLTVIFSLATALSRVLGLVREIVAAYYFGAAGLVNAFTIAFQIPNLVRALLADAALSSAFVPVFSELLEKGERKRAWRVASSLFWLMLLGLTALTAIFVIIAPWVIGLFGNPGGDLPLAIGLSRVLFPIVTLLGVSGIIVGILNSYDHFTVPALSPVVWNLAIIAGLLIGVPRASTSSAALYVYAFSILIATVIQVFLPWPWLRGLERGEERLRIVLDWRDPAVKQTLKLMVPVSIGLGLININAVIDMFFASRFINGDLAPRAIQAAFLVYMLPQGIFSVAIATVLFPTLSRLAARGDTEGFRDTVAHGLRQIAFLLIPAAALSAVLAGPIIRILFQHGAWEPPQTPVVAACLAAFSLGLVFNGAMLMLNRAFFSMQENWIPTAVALGNLFLNAVLDALLYHLGAWGIALSTALVNIAGTIALLALLRRRLGGIEGLGIASVTARIAAGSVALAAVAYLVWEPLDSALGRSFPAQVCSLGTALIASIATYVLACRVLRVREMNSVLSLAARFRRA